MIAASIPTAYDLPIPVLGDFAFTAEYVERRAIFDKQEGLRGNCPPEDYGSPFIDRPLPAYFIFVKTSHGLLRIETSHEVYHLLTINDAIVVRYQKGRWTGALKGSIAQ